MHNILNVRFLRNICNHEVMHFLEVERFYDFFCHWYCNTYITTWNYSLTPFWCDLFFYFLKSWARGEKGGARGQGERPHVRQGWHHLQDEGGSRDRVLGEDGRYVSLCTVSFYADYHTGRGIFFYPCSEKPDMLYFHFGILIAEY